MGARSEYLIWGVYIVIGSLIVIACDESEDDGATTESARMRSNGGEGGKGGSVAFDASVGRVDVGTFVADASNDVCRTDNSCGDRKAKCIGVRQIQDVISVDCHSVCGPGPCEGTSCISSGAVRECPIGMICRNIHTSSKGLTASCVNENRSPDFWDDGGRYNGGGAGTGGNPHANCGNGVVNWDESCDDGNLVSGDGCSEYCATETDWVCPSAGGRCVSQLGDSDCTQNACFQKHFCLEQPSGLSCRCPAQPLSACPTLKFIGLPFLDGTDNCWAKGISADGSTVVGSCFRQNYSTGQDIVSRAVKWTLDKGIQTFDFPSDHFTDAAASNYDGSVATGTDNLLSGAVYGAYRLSGTEIEYLSDGNSYATDISVDGSVIVGAQGNSAFRWARESGLVNLSPQPDVQSTAFGISGNGLITVGTIGSAELGQWDAVKWTSDNKTQELAKLTEATASEPRAANYDGSIIVGLIWLSDGSTRAVRWTASGIEFLSDSTSSYASAVSADGTRVFGTENAASAVIWDSKLGRTTLQILLTDSGADLTDWFIGGISDVSSDGKVVVGGAQYIGGKLPIGRSGAFIAWIP